MRPWALLLVVVSCSGGSSHQLPIGPPPGRLTQGVLFGPLCDGDHCTCRDIKAPGDGGAGLPTDTKKRFEVRLGPSPQELWVTIGGTTLYKSAERPEACFYVDLPAGDTPVELRASNPAGVSAAWTIRELGVKTRSWYDSFAFSCGAPGVCSFDELDENKRGLEEMKHHVADLCGSVKIRGLTWDTGKAPDQLHPSELLVRLALSVYRRVPTQIHGDPSCGKGPPPKDAPAAPPAVDQPPAP
jgi:hypothetical protein